MQNGRRDPGLCACDPGLCAGLCDPGLCDPGLAGRKRCEGVCRGLSINRFDSLSFGTKAHLKRSRGFG